MANKRDLKKKINYVCGDLFAECVAVSLYTGKPSKEDVDALLASILIINDDYRRRVSHPEPGMPAKKFYDAIYKEFDKQILEIVDQIGNLN